MTTKTLSQVRKSSFAVDLTKENEWLSQHKQDYVGQWVVLDGDRLVGHGSNPLPIYEQAKAEGVRVPFVQFIRDEAEPFCGAWL